MTNDEGGFRGTIPKKENPAYAERIEKVARDAALEIKVNECLRREKAYRSPILITPSLTTRKLYSVAKIGQYIGAIGTIASLIAGEQEMAGISFALYFAGRETTNYLPDPRKIQTENRLRVLESEPDGEIRYTG